MTGRMVWCDSLPFGYVNSPFETCSVRDGSCGARVHQTLTTETYVDCDLHYVLRSPVLRMTIQIHILLLQRQL